MRSKWMVAAAAAMLVAGAFQSASAGFIGMPGMLGQMAKRISFSNFTLAPMAFTKFCLRYESQCKPPKIVFRGGPVRMTDKRWDDLREVNKTVNTAIIPERNTEGLAGEKWIINPARGDCNDYAV